MIVNCLLHAICDRPEDTDERNKAIQQFKDIRSGIFVPLSPSSSNSGSQNAPFATQQSPIALTMRHSLGPDQAGFASKAMSTGYSSEYQRFHGKIDEDWPTKLSRYQFLCTQNKMTSADKISHRHYMLDGAALQFFIKEIKGRMTNYGDVIRRFNERYASAAKQDYISKRLQEICMSQFEKKSNITELRAFRDTVDEIDRLTPVAHPEDRTNRTKMLRLQHAVTGREWAKTVLSTVAANDLKYHTLIERLEYSLQQTAKHQQAALGSQEGYDSQLRSSQWNATNFAGQARHAREPRSRASIVPRYAQHDHRLHPHQKNSRPRPQTTRSPLLCHNCNKPGCRWYKCKEPLDMMKVIQNCLTASKKTGQIRASSRANTTNVVEELADDINELVETLIISSNAELCEDTDIGLNEELMVQLEQEADAHASVTYDAGFDFPHHSETEAYSNGDLGASESFFSRGLICLQVPLNRQKLPPDKTANSALAQEAITTHEKSIDEKIIATPTSSFYCLHQTCGPTRKVNVERLHSRRQYDSIVFQSACVDSGAQKSVCGLTQARAYCRAVKKPLHFAPSHHSFKFGDGVRYCLGRMEVRMRVREGIYLPFQIDAVDADVPLLLGLDLLDLHELIVENVDNVLVSKSSGWKILIERIRGHLFVSWDPHTVMFTRTELARLHLYFLHPSKQKLLNLLKRGTPERMKANTAAIIQDIVDKRECCKRFGIRSYRFRASLPNNEVKFNHEVAIDLLWINGNSILHIVDTHTGYQHVALSKSLTAKHIWDAFLEVWVTVYVNITNRIRAGQGSVFTSKFWENVTTLHGIELQLS